MMSIRCGNPATRLHRLALSGTPALLFGRHPLPTAREYHGDPGPSTVRLSRSRLAKKRLRETALGKAGTGSSRETGAVGGLDDLNMLLDAPPAPRRRADGERPTPTGETPGVRTNPEHGAPGGGQRGARYNTAEKPNPPAQRSGLFAKRSDIRNHRASNQDPFETSSRIKDMLAKASSPITPAQIDQLLGIIITTPARAVNAPVWNLVLAALGRDGKYDRMWKSFNDMKKRGVKPTSRTYTTLLNAYASVPHSGIVATKSTTTPPEPRTLSRVSIIFAQAQSHIKSRLALQPASSGSLSEDVGLALPSGESVATEQIDEEINIGPTNAYLKFLARYGMYGEMEKIFLSMDASGVLAPDVITYTAMFHALRTAHARRAQPQGKQSELGARQVGNGASEFSPSDEGDLGETVAIGPAARLLWDQAVRRAGQQGSPGQAFKIDNDLAILAVQCLSLGRPEDQRLAIALIPHLWSLPQLGDATVASKTSTRTSAASAAASSPGSPPSPRILTPDAKPSLPSNMSTLPTLPLTLPIATSILTALIQAQRPTLAAHYAHVFLLDHRIGRPDRPFLSRAIRAFADTGDVDAVLNVLEMKTPDGWGREVWGDALTAARWAGDWAGAKEIWRRMTGRWPGQMVESHATRGEEGIHGSKNRRPKSKGIGGTTNVPSTKTMSLLLKVSLNKGNRDVQTALDTFESYGVDSFFPPPESESDEGTPATVRKEDKADVVWKKDLAKDVRRAGERLLEKEQDARVRARIGWILRRVAERS